MIERWHGSDPEESFCSLQSHQGVFWLDSSLRSACAGRFSMIGCRPFARFRSRGEQYCFELEGASAEIGRGDPLAQLERRLREYQTASALEKPLPFCGGAVGFLSYDLGKTIERAVSSSLALSETPDINFAWYDAAIVWDHSAGQAWLIGVGWRRSPHAAIAELASWLYAANKPTPPPDLPRQGKFSGNMTRESFQDAVGLVKERIAAGEIYQMNLAQCFRGTLRESPAEIYRRLRRLNPAPMAVYLDAGEEVTLISSSPERFIVVDGGHINTFPIKGTRPRGQSAVEDAAQQAALLASDKERAELLMIVDLMRNDLGRICRYGSVRVRQLHALESFATVHHLVGEIDGELRPDIGVAELLRAVFPGGSITGAPKIRAMQIIEQIEPGRRGVFSGCVGYFSACGRIDLNIAIRTIVCRGNEASFHVGAGIVWDSVPAAEYEETLAKGRALFAALGIEEGGEP